MACGFKGFAGIAPPLVPEPPGNHRYKVRLISYADDLLHWSILSSVPLTDHSVVLLQLQPLLMQDPLDLLTRLVSGKPVAQPTVTVDQGPPAGRLNHEHQKGHSAANGFPNRPAGSRGHWCRLREGSG